MMYWYKNCLVVRSIIIDRDNVSNVKYTVYTKNAIGEVKTWDGVKNFIYAFN